MDGKSELGCWIQRGSSAAKLFVCVEFNVSQMIKHKFVCYNIH